MIDDTLTRCVVAGTSGSVPIRTRQDPSARAKAGRTVPSNRTRIPLRAGAIMVTIRVSPWTGAAGAMRSCTAGGPSDAAHPGGMAWRRPAVNRRVAAAAPAPIARLLPRRRRRLDLLSIPGRLRFAREGLLSRTHLAEGTKAAAGRYFYVRTHPKNNSTSTKRKRA